MKGPLCHKNGITGYGNSDYGIVLLGIAPGRDEIVTGRPFTGPSGQLIDSVLEAVGWCRSKVYCTNLICWNKDSPTVEEIMGCAPRLAQELAELKPKLVVTLGGLVCENFIGTELKKVRGRVIWNGSYYTLSTYHPAGFLRGNTYIINDIVRDLQKIAIVANWPPNYGEVRYAIIKDSAKAQEWLDNLPRDRPVALDIETSSLHTDQIDVFTDKILCVGVSDGIKTRVITPSALSGLTWPTDVRWTFQNGMFDVQGMKRYLGVTLPIVEDTMLMSYSVDERAGYHSLERLSGEYCAAPVYKDELKPYRKTGYETAPKDLLYKYNARDTAYTARLVPVLRKFQADDEVRPLYDNLLLPAARAFAEIQLRGVHIDKERLRELALDWMPQWLSLEEELTTLASESGFPSKINLNSPKQLSNFLYNVLGLPGGPSTNKETLENLEDSHPFIGKFRRWRQLDHFISCYILGVQDDIKTDERVHPYVFIHGTVTGRLAYRNPPIQTIPRRVADEFKRLRTIFGPSDSNHVIVDTDYKTAEVWCGQAYSQDPQMLADLQSGDYHRYAASSVYHKPPEKITKEERDTSKYVTFGRLSYAELKPSQLLEA